MNGNRYGDAPLTVMKDEISFEIKLLRWHFYINTPALERGHVGTVGMIDRDGTYHGR